MFSPEKKVFTSPSINIRIVATAFGDIHPSICHAPLSIPRDWCLCHVRALGLKLSTCNCTPNHWKLIWGLLYVCLKMSVCLAFLPQSPHWLYDLICFKHVFTLLFAFFFWITVTWFKHVFTMLVVYVFQDAGNLLQALESFTKAESLHGENCYSCERCHIILLF